MIKIIQYLYNLVWLLTKKFYSNFTCNKELKIDVGGAYYLRKGWKTLDCYSKEYPSLQHKMADYQFNLCSFKKLPLDDNSVSMLYSAHTIEHIPHKYCMHLFKEFCRVLRRKGVLRITCPDYDKVYECVKNNTHMDYSDYLLKRNRKDFFLNMIAQYFETRETNENFERNLKLLSKYELADYYCLRIPEEFTMAHPMYHCNWWNAERLIRFLKVAGFNKIYRSEYKKSRFNEFNKKGWLLNKGFDRKERKKIAVFVEAIK